MVAIRGDGGMISHHPTFEGVETMDKLDLAKIAYFDALKIKHLLANLESFCAFHDLNSDAIMDAANMDIEPQEISEPLTAAEFKALYNFHESHK